jgi:hypothetical protein
MRQSGFVTAGASRVSNNRPDRCELCYAHIDRWRHVSHRTARRPTAPLPHEVTVFHRGEHEAKLPPEVCHMHGDLTYVPRERGSIQLPMSLFTCGP